MFKRIRDLHPVAGIVVGVVATLVLSGTAMAVTDTSFTYSTVQSGYTMIGPGDLVPQSNGFADSYYLDAGYVSSGAATACFVAPVHLPQGARMTSVRTSYESAANGNPSVRLSRVNPVTGTGADLIMRAVVDDSEARAFVNDVVPADLRLVSNALYTYTYTVCVGNGDYFFGARIAYTYTNAGD